MASNAISGHGTLLEIGDGATPTEGFTAIAELGDIPGPTMSRSIIDVTNQASPGWKDKIAGIKDPGSISLLLAFVPTDATQSYTSGLIRDFVNGTKRNFKLIFPNVGATFWLFTGIVKSVASDGPLDGKLGLKVDIELTGAPTLA
jgi:predicted secreted protein